MTEKYKSVRNLPAAEYEAARAKATRLTTTTEKTEPREPSLASAMSADEYAVAKREVVRPTKKEN